jgi:hypothetical protein
LLHLHRVHGVMVVASDSRTARAVREESELPVVTVAHYATLDDVLARSDVRLALYVNHNPLNFSMLRFTSLVHVSLLHGDSDKVVSVSNQVKAYDFSFVAGQAAVDRMARYVPLFDARARTMVIGRPQLDAGSLARVAPAAGERRTVLYAPTWEGAQPSAAYSSLEVMGRRTVAALLADPTLRVVYRPHPLTGVRLPAMAEADRSVRDMVEAAAEAHPGAGHRVSVGGDLLDDFASADLLLCDISAVAMDWLAAGRPLVVTAPEHPGVVTASTPLTEATARMSPEDAVDAAALVRRELEDDPHGDERAQLARYYLGDVRPGAATAAFVAACEKAMAALGRR